ncbi:hypothetical protein QZH41_005583 [Actinostola sp. cb2023]|nr:hypothetical protein QZH41_005583 [Actinostola sp. cb2023]
MGSAMLCRDRDDLGFRMNSWRDRAVPCAVIFHSHTKSALGLYGTALCRYTCVTQFSIVYKSWFWVVPCCSHYRNIHVCVKDILIWCTANGLACNSDKTEVVHFTSRHSKYQEQILGIDANDVTIVPKPAARNLGVIVDSHLMMTGHVNNICKAAFFAIRNIGKIRKYLSQDDCERLQIHAFITSKLDSCNSILFGLPNTELDKLQRVQNAAARLVTRAKKTDHITPTLQRLHWLPVKARIVFKILLIT